MKWYVWDEDIRKFKCLHCDFTSQYHMGMQSHIRKHKKDFGWYEEQKKQKTLTELFNDSQTKLKVKKVLLNHKPICTCQECEIRRRITGQ